MTTEELIELQEEIEECKTEKAQLEGEQNAILKQLKEEYSCKSVKQAEAKILEQQQEIEQLEEEIENGLEELEESLSNKDKFLDEEMEKNKIVFEKHEKKYAR